ncbi:unnamed protein product, partial [Prorocentrum cordatum]
DTGATKGTKNLVMPGRHRNIGGREASGASQLKFQGATSCSTMGCEGNPARHAIDGFVNTVAGVNQLNTWTGDLGKVMQVARVEVTFESCLCEKKDSMFLEASSDGVTWRNYGSVSDVTLWEGNRAVAFERPLNARYLRLRPALGTCAAAHGSAWVPKAPRPRTAPSPAATTSGSRSERWRRSAAASSSRRPRRSRSRRASAGSRRRT